MLTITATATDENTGDVLTITQTTTAPFLADFTHTPSTSPATATLSGTAPALSQGNYEVIWSVSDGVNPLRHGHDHRQRHRGGGPNNRPVLAPIGNQTVNELETLQLSITATDDDPGQTLEFSLGEGAPRVRTHRERDLRLDPTEEQGPGTYNITFRDG